MSRREGELVGSHKFCLHMLGRSTNWYHQRSRWYGSWGKYPIDYIYIVLTTTMKSCQICSYVPFSVHCICAHFQFHMFGYQSVFGNSLARIHPIPTFSDRSASVLFCAICFCAAIEWLRPRVDPYLPASANLPHSSTLNDSRHPPWFVVHHGLHYHTNTPLPNTPSN